jgi:hypothetical protein
MKKLMILSVFIMALANPAMALEKEPNVNAVATKTSEEEIPEDVKLLLDRLEEIKSIDKSELTSSERKALRAEVKEIKSTLRANNSGLYISTGAIIVILLLIIIL